jgi:hypothetical protein
VLRRRVADGQGRDQETGEVPADSFAWQDRPDREPLDHRAPTADPKLADQLSDVDCKAVIDALQGSARTSHHERVRACDKYELIGPVLCFGAFCFRVLAPPAGVCFVFLCFGLAHLCAVGCVLCFRVLGPLQAG